MQLLTEATNINNYAIGNARMLTNLVRFLQATRASYVEGIESGFLLPDGAAFVQALSVSAFLSFWGPLPLYWCMLLLGLLSDRQRGSFDTPSCILLLHPIFHKILFHLLSAVLPANASCSLLYTFGSILLRQHFD
ncbi:hypothetical protein BJ878DRAFT_524565 [Calycina marina]|uniref:Uncharacterized protein n=1 Tax=Calycina marina TaxID=1763456 RepID=A0A9P7YW20_9HELO|nr:hypothetical protein BJ878DRAFT_524565 [Calycina marina]